MDEDQADGDGVGAPVIKVIGVGGGGTRIVQFMREHGLTGVQFVVVDTNAQDLERATVPEKVQIGAKTTGGLGTFFTHEKGLKAAEESRADLKQALAGTDLVILVAGLGGGTGGGASPVIAQIARELGIKTVAIVTLPFAFEGKKHRLYAEVDFDLLCAQVDALVMVDNNDSLRLLEGENISIVNAFNLANELLRRAVCFALDSWHSQRKLDFASAQAIEAIGCRLHVLISCVRAQGEQAVAEAVAQVVHSPWREALYVTPQSCLHLYTMLEFSIEKQDKLVEGAMRKALGPDVPCQIHVVFVSPELLTKGLAQLTLFAQLGEMEQAPKKI